MRGSLRIIGQITRLQALGVVSHRSVLPTLGQQIFLLACNDLRQLSTSQNSASSQADTYRREHRRRSAKELQWPVRVCFAALEAEGTD